MPTATILDPKTLQEAILHFSDEQNCIDALAAQRWPDGPACPACGHKDHWYLKNQKRWKCRECYRQFSAKLGTIFEDSPIPLSKWMVALWMLVNCKNGVSSYEIHRALGITQKSAWFVLQRIRLAMQNGSLMKLGASGNPVQVDETFIGGKARNMHRDKRNRMDKMAFRNKTIVAGFLEGGRVKTLVIANRSTRTLHEAVKTHVQSGSHLTTDDFWGYWGLHKEYVHQIVDHAETYVNGKIHTNGIENFWSLLKRGLHGTYISVEPFHMFRYLDEQCFRFNNRGNKEQPIHDGQRFQMVLSQVAGKRITYKELTGKSQLPAAGTV
jgi:transposase-like protein